MVAFGPHTITVTHGCADSGQLISRDYRAAALCLSKGISLYQ